ncbi:MAG: hypothetical protein V1818_00425 [Candidatus Aenigmatarchaeota archaeon]
MPEEVLKIKFRGKAAEDLEELRKARGFYSNTQVVGAALKTYNALLEYAEKDPCGTNLLTVKVVKPQTLLDKIMSREYTVELPLNLR